jgi:hypothetical protein
LKAGELKEKVDAAWSDYSAKADAYVQARQHHHRV